MIEIAKRQHHLPLTPPPSPPSPLRLTKAKTTKFVCNENDTFKNVPPKIEPTPQFSIKCGLFTEFESAYIIHKLITNYHFTVLLWTSTLTNNETTACVYKLRLNFSCLALFYIVCQIFTLCFQLCSRQSKMNK